ncbi:hypothetical protein LUZ63_022194 [Rhynchospora breviuscula]|uniref:Dihydrolipoyl dehydrogenase n=1 Tax=Rhynchospora breviuscula TaxID=2022672 RepID=A0A9P9Z6N4_9POAL|nr:hypothetical protein LUZ63_022194 [Rhynchospora breviuscula]
MDYFSHAKDYGINAGDFAPDFPAVVKRSRGVADKMSKGIQFLMKKNKIDVIMGFATVKGGGKISVKGADGNTQEVRSPKHHHRNWWPCPRTAFYADGLAKRSSAIVRRWYFRNVTIVEYAPRIVPVEDEDISKELEKSYKKRGITIMTNANVERVDTSGNGVKAFVKTATGEVTLEADVLLSAVGVVANIEGIGLEEAGVKTEKGKIVVDAYGKTSVDGLYAIGDCTPGQALAHVASKEAVVCVEAIAHAAGKYHHKPEPVDYGNVPGCTYCTPEIASVGMTEKAAREAGYELKVGKFPFSASGKASAAGATEGFVKVIFDAKYGEWLGTHMIGANVTEIISETVLGRKLETTWQEVLDAIHPHPTMSEGVKDAVEVALGEAIHL